MVVKTLITDEFDEGGEWLDADDMALLRHTFQEITHRILARREEASKARKAEPESMTVLFLVGGPPECARIWIRNDVKKGMFGGAWGAEKRWQREGSDQWYSWDSVLEVTRQGRLIPIYDRSEW